MSIFVQYQVCSLVITLHNTQTVPLPAHGVSYTVTPWFDSSLCSYNELSVPLLDHALTFVSLDTLLESSGLVCELCVS